MSEFGFSDGLPNLYFENDRYYLILHEDDSEGFDVDDCVRVLKRLNEVTPREEEELSPMEWEDGLCSEILHETGWSGDLVEPFRTTDAQTARLGLVRISAGLKALRRQEPTRKECLDALTAGMSAHA